MRNVKKYLLEITVFMSGAIVMIFEILGSRIYGPYFGTSTFVWTSLIGVILGSMSLGYYVGGSYSDQKNPNNEKLSFIILCAALSMLLVFLIKEDVLIFFQQLRWSLEISTFLSAVLLFFPVSFLLGMVSPYAVKLKMKDLISSGKTVGKMYAIGTFGSIMGTFSAGFFLIPYIGTNVLLLLLSIALLCLSLFVSAREHKKKRIGGLICLVLMLCGFITYRNIQTVQGFIDIDTEYSRIHVYDYMHKTGKKARMMQINTENHSSMFLGDDSLTNKYTNFYHLVSILNPQFQHALMIGGAGYSFPKSYLARYPEKTMDVVEIDPGVTQLAKQYFGLKDTTRLKIFHEDARQYLNTTDQQYDVIFGDAFTSYYSIPYQLTTIEAVQKQYDILHDNGIVILNTISAIEGEKGKFLRAEYATYKKIFPQVFVIPVSDDYISHEVDNIMLVAMKNKNDLAIKAEIHDGELNGYAKNIWKQTISDDMPILTDDFAPIDSYLSHIR